MKVTRNNFWTHHPSIKKHLKKDGFSEAFSAIKEFTENQETDWKSLDDVDKETIDLFFEKLNALVEKDKPKKKTAAKTPQKRTTKARKKATKPKTAVKTPQRKTTRRKATTKKTKAKSSKKRTARKVEYRVPLVKNPEDGAVKFVESFMRMVKKGKVPYKSILGYTTRLQKAIANREIRKKSPYVDLIRWIQTYMVRKCNEPHQDADLLPITLGQNKDMFQEFARKQAYTSARLLIQFIRMQGNKTMSMQRLRKAEELLKKMKDGLNNGKIPSNDPFRKEVQKVVKILEKHIRQKSKLEMSEVELAGLGSLPEIVLRGAGAGVASTLASAGIGSFFKGTNTEVMPSTELAGFEFETLDFVGEQQEFLGNPAPNFKYFIYGKQGSGKSTYALMLANFLAQHFGKVLYYSSEEGYSLTMQNKINTFGLSHPNLLITNQLSPKNMRQVDFVVIDSIQTAGLSVAKVRDLFKKFTHKGFILVNQGTKDGSYRGTQELPHDVDVVIKVENGVATTEKNRFGNLSELKIF